MVQFNITNTSTEVRTFELPMKYMVLDKAKLLRAEGSNLWLDDKFRAAASADVQPTAEGEQLVWRWNVSPGQSKSLLLKFPYLILTESSEREALGALNFEKERRELKKYWNRRLDESARLITPEPMLNEFYRALPGHLFINCEREPNSTGRFARVGSFGYGAYGNESCMMVVGA